MSPTPRSTTLLPAVFLASLVAAPAIAQLWSMLRSRFTRVTMTR